MMLHDAIAQLAVQFLEADAPQKDRAKAHLLAPLPSRADYLMDNLVLSQSNASGQPLLAAFSARHPPLSRVLHHSHLPENRTAAQTNIQPSQLSTAAHDLQAI